LGQLCRDVYDSESRTFLPEIRYLLVGLQDQFTKPLVGSICTHSFALRGYQDPGRLSKYFEIGKPLGLKGPYVVAARNLPGRVIDLKEDIQELIGIINNSPKTLLHVLVPVVCKFAQEEVIDLTLRNLNNSEVVEDEIRKALLILDTYPSPRLKISLQRSHRSIRWVLSFVRPGKPFRIKQTFKNPPLSFNKLNWIQNEFSFILFLH
jgi:hypothetical protein